MQFLANKKISNIIAIAVATLLSLLVVAMIFGKTLQPLLNYIGLGWLYHEEAGVYADCSKSSNKFNHYCQAQQHKESPTDKNWRNLDQKRGGTNPFSLGD